jgi:hypothetical protein
VGELGTPPIARSARARSRYGIPALLVLFALLLAGSAAGRALPTPVPTTPANGALVDSMPAFGWNPVGGASEYEFEISADAGFNSPVFGQGKDDFRTKNTRATVVETAPNGTYWWHVRALGKGGAVSPWSAGRSFRKNWGTSTSLISPVGGAQIVYPTTPLKLTWSPVPGARKYLVSVATDPGLGSLIAINGQARPVETSATAMTPAAALAPGVYYWGVTPLDAQGNRGTPSAVASFTWTWPSGTTPQVTDLVSDPELFDPRFSWNPVPGAARYEVEINSSVDFAPGSKVCCTGATINTSLSPTLVFADDTYYWRVRALDIDGNTGVWNVGPVFTKTFDNVPPVSAPSIKNLRMRDNLADPGTDADAGTPGYQTHVPVLTWNTVPGASSYQVDVTPYDGGTCLWSATPLQHHFTSNIALTEWTPLGSGWNLTKPYPDPHTVATEFLTTLVPGTYCARVRARSDRAFGQEVYGDYTYLDPSGLGWAFQWTGYPDGGACTPSCTAGYLGANDYLAPQGGVTVGQTPLFTWRPLNRHAWKTLKNTSGVDALTLQAKGEGLSGNNLRVTTRDYAADSSQDELVLYAGSTVAESYHYPDGNVANLAGQINANLASVITASSPLSGPPLAQLTTSLFFPGITSYFVLVAKDPSFANIVDYAFTQLPAYAPRGTLGPTTYSDETTLYYWAVLPEGGFDGTGGAGDPLAAAPQNFHKRSTPPTQLAPANGHVFFDQPTFQWAPVPGARTYRLQIAQDPTFGNPIDDVTTDSTSYSANTTYPADTVLYWRVRANDENAVGLTWSNVGTFQQRLAAPVGSPSNPTHGDFIPTWSWSVVPGAVSYDISADLPDGTHKDLIGFRSPSFTPVLMYGTGIFHWRVRAEFPHAPYGLTPGPYSTTYSFTKTIGEPTGAHSDVNPDHILLGWNTKPGVKRYRVQISGTPDFGLLVENVLTDNTSYAPLLRYLGFRTLDTSHLYWRVAAVDEGDNTGDFTQAQLITRTSRMEITIRGTAKRRKRSMLTVMVSNFETGGPVARALIRVSGAGIRARRVRTDVLGNARVTVRPTRRGALVFTATKAGFRRASARLTVR